MWYECTESHERCLNCIGNHSTKAMKCPNRKQIIKEKRNQINERQHMTYANITQASTPVTILAPKIPMITKEELLKIHICVVHAQGRDQANPGTYSDELNRVLEENNLPKIKIPQEHVAATGGPQTRQHVEGTATRTDNSDTKILK